MWSRWLLLACGCAALAGCGNSRTPLPDLSVAAVPSGFALQVFPGAGVRVSSPTNWAMRAGSPPLVVFVNSGLASIAIWRYPRSAHLPRTRAELKRAIGRLLSIVRGRDETFRLGSASLVVVDHHAAIQLRGLETIDGQRLEVRSTHLYVYGAEVVVDAFAPRSEFTEVDRLVFHPLLRRLRLQAPAT